MSPTGPKSPGDDEFARRMLMVQTPLEWEAKSPRSPGYCYLCLYSEMNWQKIAIILGSFPRWYSIKGLGNFRRNGSYRAIKQSNGAMHIVSHGAGFAPNCLDIADNEIIGQVGNSVTRGYTTPLNTGMVFKFWLVRLLLWRRLSLLDPLFLFISLSAIWPTCMLEIILGSFVMPSPDYIEKVLADKLSRRFGWLTRRPTVPKRLTRPKMLALLLCLMAKADGALYYSFANAKKTLPDDLDDDVLAELSGIHRRYQKSLDFDLSPTSMCTTDFEVRGDLLNLDIDDESLIKYIEYMCLTLVGTAWRHEAEVDWMKGGESAGDYLNSGIGKAKKAVKSTVDTAGMAAGIGTSFAASTARLLKSTAEMLGSASEEIANRASKEAIDSAKGTADTTLDILNDIRVWAVNYGSQKKHVPADIMQKALDGIENVTSYFYQPEVLSESVINTVSDLREVITKKFPSSTEFMEEGSDAIIIVADDAKQAVNTVYGDAKLLVSNTYNTVRKPETYVDSAGYMVNTITEYTGRAKVYTKEVAKDVRHSNVPAEIADKFNSIPWLANIAGQSVGNVWSGLAHGAGINSTANNLADYMLKYEWIRRKKLNKKKDGLFNR